jgi:hypothetical protein
MDSREERAQSALETMRQWRWLRFEPDGNAFPLSMDLDEVVNRLAMGGLSRPQNAVLTLLCQGHLVGTGDYTWRKYQWGHLYQLEERNERIGTDKWKKLADSINEQYRQLEQDDWHESTVNLDKLGMPECEIHEWAYFDNRFSVALCPPDTANHDPAYFEECLSVWSISVAPNSIEYPDFDPEPVSEPQSNAGVGRPLADWWPDFVAELVAYAISPGLPPGVGHKGQSQVIKEVSERLQERGKGEPSRTQIQDTVNAVLRRMRLAGK